MKIPAQLDEKQIRELQKVAFGEWLDGFDNVKAFIEKRIARKMQASEERILWNILNS